MPPLNLATKLTANLESNLGISFGVNYIRGWKSVRSTAWVENHLWRIVQVPNKRGVQFREFLYRELGHCLCLEYEIPKKFFRSFTSRNPGVLKYHWELNDFAENIDPKLGFISRYACLSNEEDFCETFSAYVLNNFKTSGNIIFGGRKFNLGRDLRLKEKFLAVAAIFDYCQQAESEYWKEEEAA